VDLDITYLSIGVEFFQVLISSSVDYDEAFHIAKKGINTNLNSNNFYVVVWNKNLLYNLKRYILCH